MSSATESVSATCRVVGSENVPIPFKLFPIDIAFVVILQQNLPLRKWLAAATALAGAPIDNLGALLTFAVSVSARVEWILEDTDHGAEIVASRAAPHRELIADGIGLVALSYRGYMGSTGCPTERGLLRDAEAAIRRIALSTGSHRASSLAEVRAGSEITPERPTPWLRVQF